MMTIKNIFIYTLIGFSLSQLQAFAITSDQEETVMQNESVILCKKIATEKRDKIMAPELKQYAQSSEAINNKTKKELDAIKWYIKSSYDSESKKIAQKRTLAMKPVTERITHVRASANTTHKVEMALCDVVNQNNNKK